MYSRTVDNCVARRPPRGVLGKEFHSGDVNMSATALRRTVLRWLWSRPPQVRHPSSLARTRLTAVGSRRHEVCPWKGMSANLWAVRLSESADKGWWLRGYVIRCPWQLRRGIRGMRRSHHLQEVRGARRSRRPVPPDQTNPQSVEPWNAHLRPSLL